MSDERSAAQVWAALEGFASEAPDSGWPEARQEWADRTGRPLEELMSLWPDAEYQWALMVQDRRWSREQRALLAGGDRGAARERALQRYLEGLPDPWGGCEDDRPRPGAQ